MCRSVPQQYESEVYKSQLQRKWESVHDHILCSKFGLKQISNVSSGLLTSVGLDSLRAEELQKLALLPNNFPYFVADPIEHWVLWKLGENCNEEDIAQAKEELQTRKGPSDINHWINPHHLNSVPEIDHVHIYVAPSLPSSKPFAPMHSRHCSVFGSWTKLSNSSVARAMDEWEMKRQHLP